MRLSFLSLYENDEEYANMSLHEIKKNYDTLFESRIKDKNIRKEFTAAYADAKIAYAIYKYRNPNAVEFWQFVQNNA